MMISPAALLVVTRAPPGVKMRRMLRLLAALALLAGLAVAQRPNVVVVLVDDLGWTDLSCQGSRYYETPHIDALAADGLRFRAGYAAAAICSPTRAAILTGREPARTHVTDWIRGRFQRGGLGTPDANPTAYVGGPKQALLCPPNPYWLELSELTLAEVLRDAGYATCHIGKWHLGDDAWYPGHQGFDENHGGCDYGQPPSYFDPYRNPRLPEGIPTLAPRRSDGGLSMRFETAPVKPGYACPGVIVAVALAAAAPALGQSRDVAAPSAASGAEAPLLVLSPKAAPTRPPRCEASAG